MNPFESSPVGFGNDLELNLADQYVSAYTPMQAEFNQSSMVGFNDAMNSGYQYTGELGTFEQILGGATIKRIRSQLLHKILTAFSFRFQRK